VAEVETEIKIAVIFQPRMGTDKGESVWHGFHELNAGKLIRVKFFHIRLHSWLMR
jgi:hypothetical protein